MQRSPELADSMPIQPSDPFRRAIRWILPAALLAIIPKCVVCLLAYAGLGAALGLGGREWCSAPATSGAPWSLLLGCLLVGAGSLVAASKSGQGANLLRGSWLLRLRRKRRGVGDAEGT